MRSNSAQSRDCAAILCNLEIGTQFRDSENAQRNLEIAQNIILADCCCPVNLVELHVSHFSQILATFAG